MDTVEKFQLQDNAVCISLCANALGKAIYHSLLSPLWADWAF